MLIMINCELHSSYTRKALETRKERYKYMNIAMFILGIFIGNAIMKYFNKHFNKH